MRKSLVLLLLLLLLVALPARAQDTEHPTDVTKSGKIFLEACSTVDTQSKQLDSFETHTVVPCLIYIGGVFETLGAYRSIPSRQKETSIILASTRRSRPTNAAGVR